MITIEYTKNSVEGEPGPNFYWRGCPNDYLKILNDLHVLGEKQDVEIKLHKFIYINIIGEFKVFLRSLKNGRKLFSIDDKNIYMELDKFIWIDILHKLLNISFYKSHDYIEFDNLTLEEMANIIISSKKECP